MSDNDELGCILIDCKHHENSTKMLMPCILCEDFDSFSSKFGEGVKLELSIDDTSSVSSPDAESAPAAVVTQQGPPPQLSIETSRDAKKRWLSDVKIAKEDGDKKRAKALKCFCLS